MTNHPHRYRDVLVIIALGLFVVCGLGIALFGSPIP